MSAADVLAGWLEAIRAAPELPLAACRGQSDLFSATPVEDQSPASS